MKWLAGGGWTGGAWLLVSSSSPWPAFPQARVETVFGPDTTLLRSGPMKISLVLPRCRFVLDGHVADSVCQTANGKSQVKHIPSASIDTDTQRCKRPEAQKTTGLRLVQVLAQRLLLAPHLWNVSATIENLDH